jgi:hypothetical protein
MAPANKTLKELYSIEWPKKCAIYQAKAVGTPVSIALWPTGKLQGERRNCHETMEEIER